MKVSELIKELQAMNPDLEVGVEHNDDRSGRAISKVDFVEVGTCFLGKYAGIVIETEDDE